MGGRYFRHTKKGSSPTGRKKTPTYGTAHALTTDDAVHPPPTYRPINLYHIQQYSSAAVRTGVHLVRGEQLLTKLIRSYGPFFFFSLSCFFFPFLFFIFYFICFFFPIDLRLSCVCEVIATTWSTAWSIYVVVFLGWQTV